jgi:hypothetical protein
MLLQAPHFYDIGILGLHWLSEHDPEPGWPRSLSPMLYALVEIELITEDQRRAAMRDALLRRKIRDQMYVAADEPGFPRDETRDRHIRLGSRHLVVMVYDPPFEPTRILARNGYRMVLTNAGHRYADKKAGPYANIVTRERFVSGYGDMRARLSEAMRLRHRHTPEADVLPFTDPLLDLAAEDLEESA